MSQDRPPGTRLAIVGGVVVLGVLVGLIFEELYRGPRRGSQPGATDRESTAASPRPWTGATADNPGVPATVPIPKETPPWESTAENTPPAPRGHIPAWVVKPPPPDPNAPAPPPPVPPPDPATHRPPLENPGGVNGDRPPRPVPGLK